MILETISYEEVLSFQNEYIQITTFNKNFLTYTINKIKESNKNLKLKTADLNSKLEYNNKYIKEIQQQKENLYKIILK